MKSCRNCIHHEELDEDSFYCEAHNDRFPEDDDLFAELCKNFKPMEDADA